MTHPAAAVRAIDVADVINRSQINALHVRIFSMCLVCLMIDGFDVQALGYVAPALIQDWKIPASALGTVFGAGNFGVLLGAVIFTMVADKVGRRPVLIGATAFFAVITLLTARATSLPQLIALRFIAGIGLGCVVPNATALAGEYSPRRLRVAVMTSISVGFTMGAAIGGFVAAWLIPTLGWRAVFYLGGVLPLLLAAAMYVSLPESLELMVLRKYPPALIGKWLRRVAPDVRIESPAEYIVPEYAPRGLPMVHLFREGRAAGTALIWTISFMNLINLYFLSNWLPTVVKNSGYSTSTGVLVGTMLQVGGIGGTFLLAWLVSRKGFVAVLAFGFAAASVLVALIGQPGLPLWLLTSVVFLAGACVVGGQPTVNGLSGHYYPTALRASGIGWGLGIGRIGAIVGPVLGGQLIALNWGARDIFLLAAIPPAISAAAMLAMRWSLPPRSGMTPSSSGS